MRGSVQHAQGLLPTDAYAWPRPKFTVPDDSLFEEDTAKLCITRECESASSVEASRLSRSALLPRIRCVLPPSGGQLVRGSSVSAASEPHGQMSDRKSLQEYMLFMVYVSVILPPRACQRPCSRLQGFHTDPRNCVTSTVATQDGLATYLCMPLPACLIACAAKEHS